MDEKRTVLLVDDDADYLFQMKLQFETAGYTVVTAESSKDAVEKLDQMKPDIAVIDLMMEETDSGFTLAHKIKKLGADIPVIMVTAVTSETGILLDETSSGSQGWIKADAVLAKPVRFDQLKREMEKLFSR